MLAPRTLPQEFADWNAKWGAPFGHNAWATNLPRWSVFLKWRGYFALQANNDTRRFEYPWAYHAVPLERGMSAVEIGGGLSGFQFVLSKQGLRVLNVDPGLKAKGTGWPCDEDGMGWLNRAFGTSVELVNASITEANLPGESFDVAYSISVLEHLTPDEIKPAIQAVYDCLKPGGAFVATFDLFLDLRPFTSRQNNPYGTNHPLIKYVDQTPFQLEVGKRDELYGSDSFHKDVIQSNLAQYLTGSGYPTLAQCVVLRKPSGSAFAPSAPR